MASVEFHEDRSSIKTARPKRSRKQPALVRLMKKIGVAKNRTQANIALLVLSLILLGAAGWIYFETTRPTAGDQIYREDLSPEMREQIPPEKLEEIPSRN